MSLTINNFSEPSFGSFSSLNRTKSAGCKKAAEALKDISTKVTESVFGDITVVSPFGGNVYEILNTKPAYAANSYRKIIEYPVRINGKEGIYSIKYRASQNNINGVGFEILNTPASDLKYLSAREIAKNLDNKWQIAQKIKQGVNVFYNA